MDSTITLNLMSAIERAARDRLSAMQKLEADPKSTEYNGVGSILREAIEQGRQDYDAILGWLERERDRSKKSQAEA